MADFPQYPKIYLSMFKKPDTVYTVNLVQRRTVNTKFGEATILHVKTDPAVLIKKTEEFVSEGEIWFSHPGSQYHDEKDWAFLESLSGVFDGGSFTVERTPAGLMVGGEGTTAVQPAKPAAQAPTAAPAAPVDIWHRLADFRALQNHLYAEALEDFGEISDQALMAAVNTRCIQACKDNLHVNFCAALDLKKKGPAPEADGDLPF